jgi:hypothetical protein
VKEEEERTRTTTVMYALLLYSKNCSSFCSIRALFTFLFFSGGERVVVSWFVFFAVWKNRKTEKKHRIKSSVIGAKIKKCRAERCDWTRVNSQTVRVYDTHHSFVHIFNHRIRDVDFFRDTTSRTLASAGLDKNQLFPCHKFRTLEICIDRSFTHPPFYNFPSN